MKSRLHLAVLVASLGLAACSTTFDGIEDTPEARGKRAFQDGHLGLAITHYQAALERAPGSIEALNGLAASYDRLGRFDVAQRYYDRALVVDRRAAQTLNNIGYSYLLQGKHDIATAYFKQALDGDRKDQIVEANLQLAQTAAAAAKDRVAAAAVKAPNEAVAAKRADNALSDDPQRPLSIERVNATTQRLVVREPLPPTRPEPAQRQEAAVRQEPSVRQEPIARQSSADSMPSDADQAPAAPPRLVVREPLPTGRLDPVVAMPSDADQPAAAPPRLVVREPLPTGRLDSAVATSSGTDQPAAAPPRLVVRETLPRTDRLDSVVATSSGADKTAPVPANPVVNVASLPSLADPVADRAPSIISAPPSTSAASGVQRQPRTILEVSNGVGRTGMAARMRSYLRENGMTVNRLTNADRYTYRATTIAYKPASKAAAEALAGLLPIECQITPDDRAVSDVKLIIGSDLRDFDATLLLASREDHARYAAR